MILYDRDGNPVALGSSIGRGGEATVYRLSSQPDRLAKIYEPAPRPNYSRKLEWMVSHPPANPTAHLNHPSLAWPDGVLLDARGQFKGYCMPYIRKIAPLLDVFNPRRRSEILPQFNRLYLHRVACNLAAALNALHTSDYIAGDLNESNVLVTASALVTLIDVDSFQVIERSGGQVFVHPCPVGKLEYTPPELQGKRLEEVARAPEHDAFGLGVLIFQILMEGSHPFRARWMGAGDPPSLEVRIAQGAFPYASAPTRLVEPPKNAPALETLHPGLVELVRRCFVDGHSYPKRRPSPKDWFDAISKAEDGLVNCPAGHIYSNHLAKCPECSRGAQATSNPARQSRPPARSSPVLVEANRQPGSVPAYSSIARRQSSSAPVAINPGSAPVTSNPVQPQTSGFPPVSQNLSPAARANPPNVRPASWITNPKAARRPSFWKTGGRSPAQGVASWLWRRTYRSLWIGGGYGALAGALPGLGAGLFASAGGELPWTLLVAMGGAVGGFVRGWFPGQRVGRWLERHLGWRSVLEWVGLGIGGLLGLTISILLLWNIVPVIIAALLGALVGRELGCRLWAMGKLWGWHKIWASLVALMVGAAGWVIAGLAGTGGMDQLVPYFQLALTYGSVRPFLMDLLSGAFAGALGGLVAGAFSDFVFGLLGLTD